MIGALRRSPRLRGWIAAVAGTLALPLPLAATWSIIAVDRTTGRVVIASATCVAQQRFAGFPAAGLMDIQAIVVPGVGVAAAQAGVDGTRANQSLIYDEMRRGTSPDEIVRLLGADPEIERRQFGIVDLQGRCAGFTGADNGAAALSVQDSVPGTGIVFSIQGNILASDSVVTAAAAAFQDAGGTITDRVMAAMEAADARGGDRRCTCTTEPVPDAPCEARTAFVAYLLVADPDDPPGAAYNDGRYHLYLNVTDDDLHPGEDANPVRTLRLRYDRWKAEGSGGI